MGLESVLRFAMWAFLSQGLNPLHNSSPLLVAFHCQVLHQCNHGYLLLGKGGWVMGWGDDAGQKGIPGLFPLSLCLWCLVPSL